MEEQEQPKIIDSFDFHLRSPVSYAFNGEPVRCDKLTLKAPGFELIYDNRRIRAMLGQAMVKSEIILLQVAAASRSERQLMLEEEKSKLDEIKSPARLGEELDFLTLMSEFDMEKAVELFGNMCTAGPKRSCALVNGNEMHAGQWSEIRDDDRIDMFLQYAAVFIQPFIFPEKKEESKK